METLNFEVDRDSAKNGVNKVNSTEETTTPESFDFEDVAMRTIFDWKEEINFGDKKDDESSNDFQSEKQFETTTPESLDFQDVDNESMNDWDEEDDDFWNEEDEDDDNFEEDDEYWMVYHAEWNVEDWKSFGEKVTAMARDSFEGQPDKSMEMRLKIISNCINAHRRDKYAMGYFWTDFLLMKHQMLINGMFYIASSSEGNVSIIADHLIWAGLYHPFAIRFHLISNYGDLNSLQPILTEEIVNNYSLKTLIKILDEEIKTIGESMKLATHYV